jgi:alanyl-tRNA synthetase
VSKIVSRLELPNAESAKTLCFQLRQELGEVFIVLAYDAGGKPGIAVMIDEKTLAEKGLDASAIVRELGREIQGGGGGQKFFATAGGKDVSGLDAVVQKAALYLS